MKIISSIIKTALLITILFTLFGCGDDGADDFPFWIDAHDSTIDLRGSGEDGISLISTTIFDDQGNPVDDGTMFFTLSQDARGFFSTEDGLSKTSNVDIDDGVAEAVYQSTLAPETIVVKAYCPRYPSDATVTKTITVINDTLQAEFSYTDEGNQIVQFYDLSGYPDENTIPTYSWDFSDDAAADPLTSTERDPYCEFSAAGTYSVTLTINGASSYTIPVVVE